jgi:glycine cleavage system T protein (aminomethyltransferase)
MALADFKPIAHFGDPVAEATACRTACALFDFAFLECAQIEGGGARQVLDAFTGRPLGALEIGKIGYALRVGPTGQAVADLTIWRTGADRYEIMSGRRQDIADLLACAEPPVATSEMADRATFALQGPASLDVLRRLGSVDAIEPLPYFGFTDATLDGITCRIGRLGYTGEAGFEIICSRSRANELWQALSSYARPGGFIAMDMLRIEAGFVLFSNEFRVPVTPQEAGLGRFYRPRPSPRPHAALITFLADAGRLDWPWRPGQQPRRPATSSEIVVTSACDSIAAGGILGLGYVLGHREPGTPLRDPTGIFRNIRQTSMPYYDPHKRRPRLLWRPREALDPGSWSRAR